MIEIPLQPVDVWLKQIDVGNLNELGVDAVRWMVPRFIAADVERRYAGDDSLGRDRYFTLAEDSTGWDHGTLIGELRAYLEWPNLGGRVGMVDSTAPNETDLREYLRGDPLERCLVLRFGKVDDGPHPFAAAHGQTEAEALDIFIPLALLHLHYDRVLDLRQPAVAEWFARQVGTLTYDLEGVAIECWPFRPPLESFLDLLPTLLDQNRGGNLVTRVIGAWLRRNDVEALIYPSARRECALVMKDGAVDAAYGWNLVDYREANPPDTVYYLDSSDHWVTQVSRTVSETEYVPCDGIWFEVHDRDVDPQRGSWVIRGLRFRRGDDEPAPAVEPRTRNDIPWRAVTAWIKQIDTEALNPVGRAALAVAFPSFRGRDDPLTVTERRYAGDYSLPNGRYFTLARDENGWDGGTLVAEMLAYCDVERVGPIALFDSTLPDDSSAAPAGKALIIEFPPLHGKAHPFASNLGFDEPVPFSVSIPVAVRRLRLWRVFDLRDRHVGEWLARNITKLTLDIRGHETELIDLATIESYRSNRAPFHGRVSFGALKIISKEPSFIAESRDIVDEVVHLLQDRTPLSAFLELLPTLVAQELGGNTVTRAIGAWLRWNGADALIYPSARNDSGVLAAGESVQCVGWNLVDYRGANGLYHLCLDDEGEAWETRVCVGPGLSPRRNTRPVPCPEIEIRSSGQLWFVAGSTDRLLRALEIEPPPLETVQRHVNERMLVRRALPS